MTDDQQDALRTVSKWLNEETQWVPRNAIAALCAVLHERPLGDTCGRPCEGMVKEMSVIYDFKSSVIKIDSMSNQISKAVVELKRSSMPEPFVLQLTPMQFDLLRFECRGLATQFSVEEGNHIHGCKIEVIGTHNVKLEGPPLFGGPARSAC